jgi:hypothetical protein
MAREMNHHRASASKALTKRVERLHEQGAWEVEKALHTEPASLQRCCEVHSIVDRLSK